MTMPLPATKVIDPRWSQHHRAVAEGQMTGTCVITRPGPGVFDETTGVTSWTAADVVYDGPCRAQASNRLAGAPTVGDVQLTQGRYMVSIPVDGATMPVQVNDQLTVTDCPDDADVVGKPMRVIDVVEGTLLWQRDLVCEHVTATTR